MEYNLKLVFRQESVRKQKQKLGETTISTVQYHSFDTIKVTLCAYRSVLPILVMLLCFEIVLSLICY